MAIEFQYNKTSLQHLEKNLQIRVRALPTIKNKESALRMEVKNAKEELLKLQSTLEDMIRSTENMQKLWSEFDATLLKVVDVQVGTAKIAGVKIPVLKDIIFETASFSVFNSPKWLSDGIFILKNLTRTGIQILILEEKINLLHRSRKKTTQKVNLFEKVQIPGYEEAILKIKRFIEDEENLSKSSQKIVKYRKSADKTELES